MLIHIPNTHIFPAIAINKLYMTTVVYWPMDLYNTYTIEFDYGIRFRIMLISSSVGEITLSEDERRHLGHRNLPTRLKQLSSVLTLCCSTHLSAVLKINCNDI